MANESTKHIKIWKATPDSKAGFMITEKTAIMAGGRNDFVVAAGGLGVVISGKSVSFLTTSENIRQGGLFTNMNDLVRMVPQTLVTPNPSQVPYPPLGFVKNVVSDLPFFLALLV